MRYTLLLSVFISMLYVQLKAQNTYQNPIISGFAPDPSICRVENDYYLVNSSFSYFPGVPVYQSKDLVNWTHLGYCLNRNSQLPLERAGISSGIWAPTIRYYKGTFFMITTNQANRKNFIVTAQNPAGPWSEPIWLEIKGYDPDLYFEPGKCYLTYTSGEGENGIMQCEINPFTGKYVTQPKVIWKGTGEFGTEGPHIYKVGDFYFLMVAEGGTGLMHSVSIARSKNVDGPWEECPSNPILTNRNKRWMRIQACGHADMVQTPDNKWFMVHLGIRNWGSFEEQHSVLGRETHLLPMEWSKDGWPVVNGSGSSESTIKSSVAQQPDTAAFVETFNGKLALAWNFIRNADSTLMDLKTKKGSLLLQGAATSLDSIGKIAFVGFRQRHHGVKWKVDMNFTATKPGEEAGITIFMDRRYHYDFFITKRNEKSSLVARRVIDDIVYEQAIVAIESPDQTLEVEANPWACDFYVLDKQGLRKQVAHMQTQFISIKVAGGFTGMYFGLYATGNGSKCTNKAEFKESWYKEVKKW